MSRTDERICGPTLRDLQGEKVKFILFIPCIIDNRVTKLNQLNARICSLYFI
jgi:hypothetical protein